MFTAAQAAKPAPFDFNSQALVASSGVLRNPFPSIADYAFLVRLGNDVPDLVGRFGGMSMEYRLPQPDSPSVFEAILD